MTRNVFLLRINLEVSNGIVVYRKRGYDDLLGASPVVVFQS
jgi:hypothetical protein